MIKKISTTEDIKLFKKAIKKAIKDFVKNEECNMAGEFAIELLNEDDSYICRIVVRPILSNTCTPDLRVSNEDSIVIENFMYGNSFNINKYTSDYRLRKVADRIINIYNGKLDWEEEMERERRLDD